MPVTAFWASHIILLGIMVVQGGYFYRRIRQRERQAKRITRLSIEQLQNQMSAQQRDLLQLAHRVEQHLTAPITDTSLSPYNQALNLIRQGLDISEVADRCGISRSEAELIFSVFRNNSMS